MNKEKRKVPKLRFPDCNRLWEEYRLADLLVERSVLCTQSEKYPLVSFTVESGVTPKTERYDREALVVGNKASKKYKMTLVDDIVYNPANLKFGAIARNKYGNAVFSPIYVTLEVQTNIVFPKFIEYILTSKCFINRALRYQQGTVYERQSVNVESLLLQTINIPAKDEQIKISDLLYKFDQLLGLYKHKLEMLLLKKKALLQKLFPKDRERYPEFRFPGFTDAWEQRKLGDCMNSFAYGLNAAAKDYDGMHKYIRITDIDDETHNFIQSNLTSPDIDFNMDVSDYKLNVGDIVFARTGASVGKTYLYNPNDGDLYYAGFLIRGTVKEDCDAGFIYQNTLTKEYDSFIRTTSQRSGQPGVNSKEYATFRLNIPCKDEQEKISKVLHSLDELFTLHQRKLDYLQLQKKALLQQMFV